MDKNYIILENRGVLEISGEDRKTFLQGLITNDINKLTPNTAIYACILTPQGKFLFDLFIVEDGERLLIDAYKPTLEELKKKLNMYKLRSKVLIKDLLDFMAVSLPQIARLDFKINGRSYLDPRNEKLGARIIMDREGINILEQNGYRKKDYQFYEELRISEGIPETGSELIPDKSFPLQYNLDGLNAIDFEKGCYVGQEVTARTKHRGSVRKKLYVLKIIKGILSAGDSVIFEGKIIGGIKSVAGGKALGLLEMEGLDKNAVFKVGEAEVKIV